MPIKRCTLPEGGQGYKWGDSGKCYKSRNDALKQMRAIKHSETQSKKDDKLIRRAKKRVKKGY